MRTQTDMRYQFSAISRRLNHAAAANSRENICQPSRPNHARSILRSKLRPTGTSHRRTSALPNIRRRNAARGIATGQISGLHALLTHLLPHLHQPRNAIRGRRVRRKQLGETFRRKRTGDHHRSHRLRAGGLLHRHRAAPPEILLNAEASASGSSVNLEPSSSRRIRVCGRLPSVSATLRSAPESRSAAHPAIPSRRTPNRRGRHANGRRRNT